MLKTQVDQNFWLVEQPHHAQVSGYLAAHFGGVNGFARPGQYPGATHPVAWRDEVVLGIAEHDNGWWESEAAPNLSEKDGLPVGLGEVLQRTPTNGFDRWRRGIPRLTEDHPYASLLISLHAYWLYAIGFDDVTEQSDEVHRHFVFSEHDRLAGLMKDRPRARAFLDELEQVQDDLKTRLAKSSVFADAVQPEFLHPHLRLLQLADSISLMLAMNDQRDHVLVDIPRGSWADRVELSWRRLGERCVRIDPYPFDLDPLPVYMPTRIVSASRGTNVGEAVGPMTSQHATPIESVVFELTSGEAS